MCGLVCGSNITEIVGKEKATIKRHFSEVDVATLENMLTEKVIHGKPAADFKKLFTQQPLIISTFTENILTIEFVEQLIKGRFGFI